MFNKNENRLFSRRSSDQEAVSELETIEEAQPPPAADRSPLMGRRGSGTAPASSARNSPESGSPRVRRALRFGLRKGSVSSLLAMAVHRQHDSHGRSQSLPFIQKPPAPERRKERGYNLQALSVILSLLYGKMLVILGLAFPVAQFISKEIPATYFEGFYLFLYFGYMVFLLCLYGPILKQKAVNSVINGGKEHSEDSCSVEAQFPSTVGQVGRKRSRYGSFYLRISALVFGIGSMIYSVLEFGQFFVMKEDEKCRNLLIALTPAVRVVFIITQLQFIFNTDKQLTIKNFKSLARFGLMHMMATNVCVWFNVLVQESKYEILKYHDIESRKPNSTGNSTDGLSYALSRNSSEHRTSFTPVLLGGITANKHRATRGLLVEDLYECRHDNIMGSLVQDASPFLFPCTIEYSLICAVILYTMWKDACSKRGGNGGGGAYGNQVARAKPTKASAAHHVRVDCASAHKGLFAGVLVLVLTIISLVMFFVLVEQPGLQRLAVLEVNLATLALYGLSVLATGLCAYRIKELRYDNNRCFELDNTLLVVAQWGLYASNISSMLAVSLGDHARPDVLVKSVASTAQATLQTVFIVDAWWRICTTPSQMRRRPGRQLVTFLLVTNLALWLVSRTQTARPEFQPVEVRFYGVRAWTIISHVTMPLAIFYRFHSTVCLCEIWKCCYKMKLVSAR